MATRDITADFITIRNSLKSTLRASTKPDSAKPDSDKTTFLDEEQGGASGEGPAWVETLEKVKEIEGSIKSRMARLKELHILRLKPMFNKDREKEEREINEVTEDIQGLFREGEQVIRQLVQSEGDLKHMTPDEQKLHENVHISLVTQMNELSKAFRAEQHRYFAGVKKQKEREGKLSGVPTDDDALREQLTDRYVSQGFTQEQIEALTNNEALIAERDAEMSHIYKSIVDLHEIFKDMNALVIDQGTLVDRIDYNMEETKKQVLEANKELVQAATYQKKSRFCLIVGILGLLIIGMIFALVLKVMKR